MKQKQFDVSVDDDSVDILDWIHTHFENGNWHKNFEVTVTVREIDFNEDEDGLQRIYVD